MMKEIKRFENAKVGDKVWSSRAGWGLIEAISGKGGVFSARFERNLFYYYPCGRDSETDLYPDLYNSEEEFIKERLAIHGHLLERVTAPSFVPDLSPGAVNTADISREYLGEIRKEETREEIAHVHRLAGRPDRIEHLDKMLNGIGKEQTTRKKREDALDFIKNDLVAINEEISGISEYLGGFSDSKGIEMDIAARRIRGVYNLIGNLIDKEDK